MLHAWLSSSLSRCWQSLHEVRYWSSVNFRPEEDLQNTIRRKKAAIYLINYEIKLFFDDRFTVSWIFGKVRATAFLKKKLIWDCNRNPKYLTIDKTFTQSVKQEYNKYGLFFQSPCSFFLSFYESWTSHWKDNYPDGQH